MNISKTPASLAEHIAVMYPCMAVSIIVTPFGEAVKLVGKGARVVATCWCRERYYDGYVNTHWRDVRHGLGYLVPCYDNPMDMM